MTKSSLPKRGSHLSAQKIHAILLLILGLCFVALGFRSFPAFIVVGALFILVAYRGYTASFKQQKTPKSDSK